MTQELSFQLLFNSIFMAIRDARYHKKSLLSKVQIWPEKWSLARRFVSAFPPKIFVLLTLSSTPQGFNVFSPLVQKVSPQHLAGKLMLWSSRAPKFRLAGFCLPLPQC